MERKFLQWVLKSTNLELHYFTSGRGWTWKRKANENETKQKTKLNILENM